METQKILVTKVIGNGVVDLCTLTLVATLQKTTCFAHFGH
jgi:hypothetical protein